VGAGSDKWTRILLQGLCNHRADPADEFFRSILRLKKNTMGFDLPLILLLYYLCMM